MYVSTSAINIKMYSKGRSVLFYSKTFGYYKNWRRVDTSQRVYPRLKHIFPRVPVYLDWDVPRISDHSVQDIKDVLNGMNDLLFDACDGQIRIGKFVLYDKSRKPRTAARGSIHFHVSGAHGGMGMATLGDPAKPGKIHLGRDLIDSHGGPEPHAHYSYTALMEFCHAYFKMLDEYNPGGKGRCADNDQFACPLDHNVGGRRRPNPDMTEFCGPDSWGRPYAHFRGGNPKNDMESRYHMGCYEWLKKIMWDKKKKNIEIPTSPLQGPKSAPKPVWEYRI